MKFIRRFIFVVLPLFITAVFVDSLRFKFSDHANTRVIFGRLNDWATTLGIPGLFAPGGLFGPYVIGSAELLASALLTIGFIPRFRALQAYGALLALLIMSGAISFHLLTPLGIDPNRDGGGLFIAAVLVWLASLVLLIARRHDFPFLQHKQSILNRP